MANLTNYNTLFNKYPNVMRWFMNETTHTLTVWFHKGPHLEVKMDTNLYQNTKDALEWHHKQHG